MYSRTFIGQTVHVTIDRPLGSRHPQWNHRYPINYGYLAGVPAPDGEDLDAYILGVGVPRRSFTGRCIAVIHRLDDADDKLIVVPEDLQMSDEEIEEEVHFQEKYFSIQIIRCPFTE